MRHLSTPRCLLLVGALHALAGCGGAQQPRLATSGTVDAAEVSAQPRRARDLAPTQAEAENVVFTGGTILTAAGERLEGGSLWIRDGRIEAVSAEPLEAPGATRVDVTGRFLTPGLIDSHSHLGVYPTPGVAAHADGNEMTSPATPQVDAIHSVWPQDPGFEAALRGGVTLLQILPGSANIIGGQATTLQLHPGVSARAMLVEEAPGGIKMACGENPKRTYGERGVMPSTRMGTMSLFRQTLQKAVDYRDALTKYEEKLARWEANPIAKPEEKPEPPKRDLSMEPLVDALEGESLVHVHCYRADEMVQMLELAEEFGFRIRSFHHAVEAYKIRDLLAAWDVSVSTWADWWGFKMEAHDAIPQNAGLLETAGARAIIHSDSAEGIQRLNQEAAKAYWAAKHSGLELSEDDALRWITANPAWALGIEEIAGTLEPGKRADVVVWSHHPFSVYAAAEQVFVEGVREYDAARDADAAPWSDFELGQLPPAETTEVE